MRNSDDRLHEMILTALGAHGANGHTYIELPDGKQRILWPSEVMKVFRLAKLGLEAERKGTT